MGTTKKGKLVVGGTLDDAVHVPLKEIGLGDVVTEEVELV